MNPVRRNVKATDRALGRVVADMEAIIEDESRHVAERALVATFGIPGVVVGGFTALAGSAVVGLAEGTAKAFCKSFSKEN